jgi:hypothetical protein
MVDPHLVLHILVNSEVWLQSKSAAPKQKDLHETYKVKCFTNELLWQPSRYLCWQSAIKSKLMIYINTTITRKTNTPVDVPPTLTLSSL